MHAPELGASPPVPLELTLTLTLTLTLAEPDRPPLLELTCPSLLDVPPPPPLLLLEQAARTRARRRVAGTRFLKVVRIPMEPPRTGLSHAGVKKDGVTRRRRRPDERPPTHGAPEQTRR
jgi:hypothetical protein